MDFFTTVAAEGILGVVGTVVVVVVVTGEPAVLPVVVTGEPAVLPVVADADVVVVAAVVLPEVLVLVIIPLPVPALTTPVTAVEGVPAVTAVVEESVLVAALLVSDGAAAVELVDEVASLEVPPDDWHPATNSESTNVRTAERTSVETTRSSLRGFFGNKRLMVTTASSRLLYLLQTSLWDGLLAALLCSNCDNPAIWGIVLTASQLAVNA